MMTSHQTNRCDYLDSLKGIAIIAVIITHAGGGNLPGLLGRIGSSGARGVQLFLIISVFLNLKSAEHFFDTPEGVTIGKTWKWYLKKLFRLVPLYYIAIALSLITGSWSTYWLGTENGVTISNILLHLLFLHGFVPEYCNSILGVEWYLGVLVVILFLTPWLYKVLSFEKTIAICILILVVKQPLRSYVLAIAPISDSSIVSAFITDFNLLAQSLTWMMGILLYYFSTRMARSERNRSAVLSYLLLVFVLLMLYGQVRIGSCLYHFENMEMFSIWFVILILSQMIHPSKVINNIFLRKCGEYSYGMYLFQFIWLRLYDRFFAIEGYTGTILRIIVAVIGLWLLSVMITTFIDKIGVYINETLFEVDNKYTK